MGLGVTWAEGFLKGPQATDEQQVWETLLESHKAAICNIFHLTAHTS